VEEALVGFGDKDKIALFQGYLYSKKCLKIPKKWVKVGKNGSKNHKKYPSF
jgi:hypothetical protein